jgi:predicted O-methyltransferase YrrM
MTAKSTGLDPALHRYILETSVREDELLRELREETAKLENARMQIGPEQGQFMALLAQAIGARAYLEVGVFTGYSSIAVGCALAGDKRIVACDISEEYTAVARRYWARAGLTSKIDLRLGPALETLDALLAGGETSAFDLAFIDADKVNVDGYYERALRLIRTGGLVLVDNVLWHGDVADPSINDEDTQALRALNEKIGKDERVDCSLLAICDGLMVARKR